MTEAAGREVVTCPACAVDTAHEVLSPGGQATVRCTDCGHTHKVDLSGPELTTTRVVVSQDGESFTTDTDVPVDERLAVGEEFVAETDEAVLVVRITDLQLPGDKRTDAAPATEVETIWTRAVGNVSVDITVHPTDGGAQPESHTVTAYLPGEDELVVGAEREIADADLTIEGIVVRDDAVGYPTRKLDREGDAVPAKDCKRVYARAPGPASPAWGW
jgi:uncharacterized Zn finger protein